MLRETQPTRINISQQFMQSSGMQNQCCGLFFHYFINTDILNICALCFLLRTRQGEAFSQKNDFIFQCFD